METWRVSRLPSTWVWGVMSKESIRLVVSAGVGLTQPAPFQSWGVSCGHLTTRSRAWLCS